MKRANREDDDEYAEPDVTTNGTAVDEEMEAGAALDDELAGGGDMPPEPELDVSLLPVFCLRLSVGEKK